MAEGQGKGFKTINGKSYSAQQVGELFESAINKMQTGGRIEDLTQDEYNIVSEMTSFVEKQGGEEFLRQLGKNFRKPGDIRH